MKLSDFDFHVPEELVAQAPLERRDASRMLVLHRKTGEIEHVRFADLKAYLRAGDTLVFNKSKVIKARIFGQRETGGKVEAFLLSRLAPDIYECLVKLTAAQKTGVKFKVSDRLEGTILGPVEQGMIYRVRFSLAGTELDKEVDRCGRVPLPPYIKRDAGTEDQHRYQTVYAQEPGSVAAPTAGLHFTPVILEDLKKSGIETEYVTLHVGIGTFQPIKVEAIDDHRMHKESFSVPSSLSGEALLNRKKAGRIVAVGTTSVRALESASRGFTGETELFLRPGSEFKSVDALFTNFHQPKSSLIVMVSAFVGDKELLFRAYREAIEKRYRFFSYGDCMLIL